MAHSYYSPRRTRRHSVSDVPISAEDDLTGDLEQSIFIFPSPRTGTDMDPSSPLSIPTDASFPTTTTTTEGRGRRLSSVSGISDWATFSVSARSVSVDTSSRSPLVEVWEMSDEADGDEDVGAGHAATTLDAGNGIANRQQLRYPLGRRVPSQFVFSDGRLQLRARKESFISQIDSQNSLDVAEPESALTPSSPASKQPVPRLPLLAFFSSLLSVEETTLHLLNRPSHPHTSPLFPGGRLHSINEDDDTALDEKRALFALSSTASMKAGLDVTADPSVMSDSIFALPVLSPTLPLLYVWKFVKGACSIGVPKRVRMHARAA